MLQDFVHLAKSFLREKQKTAPSLTGDVVPGDLLSPCQSPCWEGAGWEGLRPQCRLARSGGWTLAEWENPPSAQGVMPGAFRGSPALGRRLPVVGGAVGGLPPCVLLLSWVFSVWCPGVRAARPCGSRPRLRQTSVKQTEDRTW